MAFESSSSSDCRGFDSETEASAPGLPDIFNDASGAVSDIDRNTRALIAKLLDLGRSGDPSQSVGYRAAGNPKGAERRLTIRKQRDEDDMRAAMRIATAGLDQRIAELDEELKESDKKLKAIEDKLSTVDELQSLYDTGRLDPNNPAHRALLEKAGISVEDYERDPALALILARRHGDEERDYWKRQRDDVVQEREKAEALRERAEGAQTPQEVASVAEDFAKRRKGGEDAAAKAIPDLGDARLVRPAVAASGLDSAEQQQALLARGDDHGFSGGFDDGPAQRSTATPVRLRPS